MATQDVNRCGIATLSITTLNWYLVEEYFCGIYLLRLMILDLVLLEHSYFEVTQNWVGASFFSF